MKFRIELASESNLTQIVDFLSQEEKSCITLMSRFIREGKITFLPKHIKGYSIFFGEELVGFIAISDSGIILHHFDKKIFQNPSLDKLKKLIFPILDCHTIYSIVGDFQGTDFLREIIQDVKKTKIQIPYILMKYENSGKIKNQELPSGFSLKKCTIDDTNFLYSLQAAYDIVEVIPPGEDFDADSCRLNLRHNLGTQYIIGIVNEANKRFVAKAGTNAIGLNWVQLGGVFTKEEYRGKGFATYMTQNLAKIMLKKRKNVALFVKEKNIPAQKAYLKAGFVPISRFFICYY